MRHVILTCKNHPDLRWNTKECAWSVREDGTGYYNNSRHIRFMGTPSPRGMYRDMSGLDCDDFLDGKPVVECQCPAQDLIAAPEDSLVRR